MSSKRPKHSILIPNYNDADLLKLTYDALLAQSFCDFEVITVDDGSTDHSREVIESYAKRDRRFKYHFNQSNQGVHESLNIAFELSSGNYLSASSSGDFYYPEFLNIAHEAFKKYTQAKIWSCHVDIFREALRVNYEDLKTYSSLVETFFAADEIVPLFRHSPLYIHGFSAVIERQTFITHGRFYSSLGPLGDWYLFHKMALHEGVIYTPKFLAQMQILDTSYSRKISLNRKRRHEYSWKLIDQIYEQEDASTKAKFLQSGLLTSHADSLFWKLLRQPKYWGLLRGSKTSTTKRLLRVLPKKLGLIKSTIPRPK